MTWPNLTSELTPERLAELRLIVSGATRDRAGRPFRPSRARLAWFARNGYVVMGPPLGPSPAGPRNKAGREYTVTDKAREAVKERKTA